MISDARKRKSIFPDWLKNRTSWLALLTVVVVFIVLVYPSLVIQEYAYQIGDIADRDIKAPHDFFIEDKGATETSREQAVEQILTVYDYDPRIGDAISARVHTAFAEMRRLISELSPPQAAPEPNTDAPVQPIEPEIYLQELERTLLAHKGAFESRIGIDMNRGAYKLLMTEKFSVQTADLIGRFGREISNNGIVANKEVLLKETEKGITLRNMADQTEKTAYALRQYYGPDQAKTMVRIVAEPIVKDLNYNLVNLIVDICQRLLQPNITINRHETEERKKQALAEIKPIMYKIKAGEMLLREGERVNAVQLLKLRAMNQQKEDQGIQFSGLGAALILFTVLIVIHVVYFEQPRHARINTTQNILFMAFLLVLVMLTVKIGASLASGLAWSTPVSLSAGSMVYAVPVAAAAMLVCIFLGFEIALPFSLAASVCAALLYGKRLEIFLFFFINNVMAAYWVQHCRERRLFITAGAKLGLLNMLLATATSMYAAELSGTRLVWDLGMAFAGGLFSGIITVGMAPLAEMTFHYATDITLLELANLDRPILRQLMLEAPGTYHHSVVVGSLVEAAASEIGANPVLAKVCGYYHDIGKVKKPLYFIENQTNGRNKHDKLAPSMSSLILIAHVKEGLEIARKNKLGQVIIDTIQQHHGTSLISYFYEKAKQLKGADAVKIDDFRYPGPKPQTKEAGLVMLADVVEAASRALENPTPARIQGMVQTLINKIFFDGQLDKCELTLKDLHSIAKSFNKILNGIHHHRIEYAEASTKENGKAKNGSTDRQSTGKTSNRDPGRAGESPDHLKRLGLS